MKRAGVAELVDAPDLGSGGENRGGSSPSARTSAGTSPRQLEFRRSGAEKYEKVVEMQATETLSQGLKREYKVVLPAGDLAEKLNAQITGMKDKAQIKGFRPGKVPVAHLKRVYGKSIMGDVVQEAVNDAQQKILDDNELRLAGAPKFEFPRRSQAEMEKALEANGDLSFSIAFEVLPTIEVGSFDDVELERLVAEIPEGTSRTRSSGWPIVTGPTLPRRGRRRRKWRQADDRFRWQDRRRGF